MWVSWIVLFLICFVLFCFFFFFFFVCLFVCFLFCIVCLFFVNIKYLIMMIIVTKSNSLLLLWIFKFEVSTSLDELINNFLGLGLRFANIIKQFTSISHVFFFFLFLFFFFFLSFFFFFLFFPLLQSYLLIKCLFLTYNMQVRIKIYFERKTTQYEKVKWNEIGQLIARSQGFYPPPHQSKGLLFATMGQKCVCVFVCLFVCFLSLKR